VEHYWRLVGMLNGWPATPELGPVFTWFADALRAHGAQPPDSSAH
jgi:hypothetical protein